MTDVHGSAAYYQAHKDDAEEWGDAVESTPQPARRLAVMLSARFAPDEVDAIRTAAAAEDSSLSNFIRMAALARAQLVRFPVHVTSVTATGFTDAFENWGMTAGTVANNFSLSPVQL